MHSTLVNASLAILEVRAGQQAAIAANEAQVAFLSSKRDRVRTLAHQDVASQSQLDEVEHDYTVAVSMLEQAKIEKAIAEAEAARARIELDELMIRAPNAGVIIDVLADPGEFTSSDHPILRMAQLNPLHVEAYLPIALYKTVTLGQRVTVTPAAPVGGGYAVAIKTIDVVFDTASGTFGIEADLPNPLETLPAGNRCVLSLDTKSPP
jgi:RND family efflux transporter MFP subunit